MASGQNPEPKSREGKMRKFKLLLVAVVALAVVAMPSEAARPSGPTITSFTYDAACNITVTYKIFNRNIVFLFYKR